MVIVKIKGGLGNQMFQYAFGKALSLKKNSELKLDVYGYQNNNLREYKLNCFKIKENFATPGEIADFKPSRNQPVAFLMGKIRRAFLPAHKQKVLFERNLYSYNSVFDIRDDVYLDGFWQSEKYFSDVSDAIRKNFTFTNEPDEENFEKLQLTGKVNSVSLHIRRGDYLFKNKYRVLDLCYYARAMDFIAQRVKNPEVFVFSDDIGWAHKNLKVRFPVCFIDHNGECRDYEDLRLMRSCRHHIIANSSFSWWGAWLGEYPGKIVVAPKKWFNIDSIDDEHLIPEAWFKI